MEGLRSYWGDNKSELFTLLSLSLPASATYLLNRLVGFTSILFVGRLGPAQLAAAALGGSLTNVVGFGILNGLTGGMPTLCGQAFGAKKYKFVGLVYQRVLLIMAVTATPMCAILLAARPLLMLGGQSQEVAETTAAYIRYSVPSVFGYAGLVTTNRYLQFQGIVRPQVAISAIVLLLHPATNWLLIYGLGMGFQGAALASSVSSWLQFLLLALYAAYFKTGEVTWPGWSRECLQDWWPYIKLAIPSVILGSEWLALEIAVMMGGLLPAAALQLSAMAIYNSTNDLCFMISNGMAVAIASRVSNELGAGHAKTAKHVCNLGLSLVAGATCCLGIFVFFMRSRWGLLFTSDPALISVISSTLAVLAFFIFFDGLSVALGGVVRGTGKQAMAAPCTLASYYLLGLPAAALLAFPLKLGVQGLCLGILLGAAATDACFYLLMWRTDWSLEAAKAAERVGGKSELSNGFSHDDVALQHVTSSDNMDGRLDIQDESETAVLLRSTTGGAKSSQATGQLP